MARYTFADRDRLDAAVRQAFAGQDGAAQDRAIAEVVAFYQAIIASLDERVRASESCIAQNGVPAGELLGSGSRER